MSKRKFLTTIALMAAVGLSACVRQGSEPPTPAGGDNATLDPLDSVFRTGATLTALASGGGSQPTSPSFSGGLVGATSTPLALPSATPAPTATPTLMATQALTVPATYSLHQGEYPYCIARRFNIDADQLLKANGLTTADVYSPGDTLTIPVGAGEFGGQRKLSPHPTQYTVISGDNVYKIACKFGDVWPESIAQVNEIDIDAKLTPGQILQIP
ncbi:MAG: LysM peptidoglycan-binding domain-containing protein [Anaerolineae bacterium]|nr:LysM peptidoglycan-binding domain-containing protein [Anaerolineae bacterium]